MSLPARANKGSEGRSALFLALLLLFRALFGPCSWILSRRLDLCYALPSDSGFEAGEQPVLNPSLFIDLFF